MTHPRIGIALGSGSSRGWAHIGVLRALAEHGIHPDIICGCSVGAIVGAAYAAGNLNKLEGWVLSLTRMELVRFFELNPSLNGFVRRDKLQQFFHEHVCDESIQIGELPRKFASVATDLENGREVWFTEGGVLDSVAASISLPGLFTPYQHGKRWLVDGGLVNPVPVSLCRALGADMIIAVNLNGNVARRYAHHNGGKSKNNAPGLMDALAASVNIMQDKVTRSRMAGDPPEILLTPRLENIGLLEFHRAAEAIAEGHETVERMHADISNLLSL